MAAEGLKCVEDRSYIRPVALRSCTVPPVRASRENRAHNKVDGIGSQLRAARASHHLPSRNFGVRELWPLDDVEPLGFIILRNELGGILTTYLSPPATD